MREIYQLTEPIVLIFEFPTAQDVLVDLIDPITDTVVFSATATELTQAEGVYVRQLSVIELDSILIKFFLANIRLLHY